MIRRAYDRGRHEARFWQRQGSALWPEYMAICPYSTYMPAVRLRVAWQIGVLTAYGHPTPGQRSRALYAL